YVLSTDETCKTHNGIRRVETHRPPNKEENTPLETVLVQFSCTSEAFSVDCCVSEAITTGVRVCCVYSLVTCNLVIEGLTHAVVRSLCCIMRTEARQYTRHTKRETELFPQTC
ncbi:unnamed protein product, partial [Ectocarpus sp. 12 AP-2014]